MALLSTRAWLSLLFHQHIIYFPHVIFRDPLLNLVERVPELKRLAFGLLPRQKLSSVVDRALLIEK